MAMLIYASGVIKKIFYLKLVFSFHFPIHDTYSKSKAFIYVSLPKYLNSTIF